MSKKNNILQDNLVTDELLLEYKRKEAIIRLIRAGFHEYNNIFASAVGLLRIIIKRKGKKDKDAERTRLIEELLQRGVQQTDLLYGFTSASSSEQKIFSAESVGKKATVLLNTLSSKHTFILDQEEDALPGLYGSPHDITLLLLYIGENSIESMQEGGTVRLHLSEDWQNGQRYVLFRMLDSGYGFASELQNDVFEPFNTVHDSGAFKGLGLFAAHRIAQNHQGLIELSSRAEGGTEVMVQLPAATDSDMLQAKSRRSESKSSPGGNSSSSLAAQVFLVIDDEVAMQKMLTSGLRRRGHQVHCAGSCGEAVELFRHNHEKITCILLDIQLGDSSGAKCAEKLLGISGVPLLILMSGDTDSKETAELTSRPFLKKPFSIKELENMVKQER